MSYIGKILVVMQLVLSICLMAFAAAVSTIQTNWKTKSESVQKLLTAEQATTSQLNADLKTARDSYNAKEAALKTTAGELASKVSLLTTEVENLKGTNLALSKEAKQRTQIGIDLADDSIARQNEVKLVRINYKNALEDRDKEYKAKAALEDKIFEQTTEIDRLKNQNKALLVENKGYKDVLVSRGLPQELAEYTKAKVVPPKVEGKVLEARKSTRGGQMLLTISLGENDGLTVGNELFVYRGGANTKYLGKARVLDVQADEAVCELFQRAGLVEKGDDVSTKLN